MDNDDDDENEVVKYLDSAVHGTWEDLTLANSKTRYTALMTDQRLCTDHVVHAPHLYQYHYAHLQCTVECIKVTRTMAHTLTQIIELGAEADLGLRGSQPAGDSMHSHELGDGLPPPPNKAHSDTHAYHKPGGRLPLLSARPAVTFPAVGHHCP